MKRLLAISILAVGLAGCDTSRHDEFGNAAPPFGVPTATTFDPVLDMRRLDRVSLHAWCDLHGGTQSHDGAGCVVRTDPYLLATQRPCIEALADGLSDREADATRQFLNAVCNGWRPV
jgi:hypothetical protein